MSATKTQLDEAVEAMVNIAATLEKRIENGVRRLELALVMQNLMVMQLDGALDVGKDTMALYLAAMAGTKKAFDAFRKHVTERYFGAD